MSSGRELASKVASTTPAKRTRACEACRRLKSQCIYASAAESRCNRCIKSKRPCVPVLRKPRTKNPPNVTALERKIRTLMLEIEEIKSNNKDQPQNSDDDAELQDDGGDDSVPFSQSVSPGNGGESSVFSARGNASYSNSTSPRPRAAPLPENYPEVICSGYLSLSNAHEGFEHFRSNMLPHFPVLDLPPSVLAPEVLSKKPVLFLAILNAACGIYTVDIQDRISKELLKKFACLIMVDGEKSLELIQALQVATIWHYAPVRYRNLKYYQLVHCACVMAVDLGLNGKRPSRLRTWFGSIDLTDKEALSRVFLMPNTLEARRAWLGCYFISSQIAQKRENLIRWSTYLEECMSVLERPPEALDSDRILCRWIRYQHIADDVGNFFSISDPCSSKTLEDVGHQFSIRHFEIQIAACEDENPHDIASLRMAKLFDTVFLHEVALHSGSSPDDMQPPFTKSTLEGEGMAPSNIKVLTSNHVKSLSMCVTNTYKLLDIFLNFSVEDVRHQPMFQFVRLIYNFVVLVKIYLGTRANAEPASTAAGCGYQRKISEYLDAVIEKLQSAARDNKCAGAAKYGGVIQILCMVFRNTCQRSSLIQANEKRPASHVGLQPQPDRQRPFTQDIRMSLDNTTSDAAQPHRTSKASQLHLETPRSTTWHSSEVPEQSSRLQNRQSSTLGDTTALNETVIVPSAPTQNLQDNSQFNPEWMIDFDLATAGASGNLEINETVDDDMMWMFGQTDPPGPFGWP